MVACSRCEKSNKRCVGMKIGPNVGRCAECCRQGKTCDVRERNQMPSVSDWESIDRQRQRLRDEEEEAMAKILRLRKQQRFLDEREKKMIAAGLSSMDELDALEEKEKLEKERVDKETADVAAPVPSGSPSFDFFGSSLPPLSDAELEALLADVGTSGGMPVVSQGS